MDLWESQSVTASIVSLLSVDTMIFYVFLPDFILQIRLDPREGSMIGGRTGIGVCVPIQDQLSFLCHYFLCLH